MLMPSGENKREKRKKAIMANNEMMERFIEQAVRSFPICRPRIDAAAEASHWRKVIVSTPRMFTRKRVEK